MIATVLPPENRIYTWDRPIGWYTHIRTGCLGEIDGPFTQELAEEIVAWTRLVVELVVSTRLIRSPRARNAR
jgi:hypothetical protein